VVFHHFLEVDPQPDIHVRLIGENDHPRVQVDSYCFLASVGIPTLEGAGEKRLAGTGRPGDEY
jgi:hypothetical protein